MLIKLRKSIKIEKYLVSFFYSVTPGHKSIDNECVYSCKDVYE